MLWAVGILEIAGYVLDPAATETLPTLDVDELRALLESPGLQLVDVRETTERDSGYLAGLANIPYRLLRKLGCGALDRAAPGRHDLRERPARGDRRVTAAARGLRRQRGRRRRHRRLRRRRRRVPPLRRVGPSASSRGRRCSRATRARPSAARQCASSRVTRSARPRSRRRRSPFLRGGARPRRCCRARPRSSSSSSSSAPGRSGMRVRNDEVAPGEREAVAHHRDEHRRVDVAAREEHADLAGRRRRCRAARRSTRRPRLRRRASPARAAA